MKIAKVDLGRNGRRIVVAMMVLVLVGCGESGPKLEPVTGKVLKDGEVMTNVSIAMVPITSGLAAMGTADSSGNIQILTNGRSGAMVGKYKIGFTEPLREMTPEALASGSPPPVSFHGRFESPQTSGVEYEVVEGGGTFEFKISKK